MYYTGAGSSAKTGEREVLHSPQRTAVHIRQGRCGEDVYTSVCSDSACTGTYQYNTFYKNPQQLRALVCITRAVFRLVWPFDGIVQKHIRKRLI